MKRPDKRRYFVPYEGMDLSNVFVGQRFERARVSQFFSFFRRVGAVNRRTSYNNESAMVLARK